MTYHGQVKNGVIVLDPPATLPEGSKVDVSPAAETAAEPSWADVFKNVIGKATGLPSDSSANHDHYLYDVSKK